MAQIKNRIPPYLLQEAAKRGMRPGKGPFPGGPRFGGPKNGRPLRPPQRGIGPLPIAPGGQRLPRPRPPIGGPGVKPMPFPNLKPKPLGPPSRRPPKLPRRPVRGVPGARYL
jgi:hypothetical protein